MQYWELFQEESIFLDLTGKKKEDVLKGFVGGLVESKLLDKKEGSKSFELLKKREQIGSTGIGKGVAIPHIKYPGFKKVVAALGVHREGVEYRSIDGGLVRVLVLIIRPDEDAEHHLKFLQWVSKLGRHADFHNFVLGAKDKKEVLALLKEMSSL